MGFLGGGGYPQYLFLQEATPTATQQGQLWVKISTNVLSQSDATKTWHPVLAAAPQVPIGSIISWAKSYTGTPSLPADNSYVQCDGQTLSDGGSVYNGQVIPNLNATNRFLRGQTTSGGTGGSETHSHSIPQGAYVNSGGGDPANHSTPTGNTSTLPTYYEVVWIMRVK